MARLRFALSIIGIAAALQLAFGQMMMVPGHMILRHPDHPHLMGPLLQSVQITERPEYPAQQERIDETKAQLRIKELETSQQTLREKQVELDDKIAFLHDEALRYEKQIAEAQQEIHKLEELERLHYVEQVRLERLLEQQRISEYQEKLHQERLAQQRAIDEMNREDQQRAADRKASHDANEELPGNATYEGRAEDDARETYQHRLDETPRNEPGKDTTRTEGLPGRAHKNDRPHSTAGLLGPNHSRGQETLDDIQPKIPPMVKHVIEKKEVHDEPKKELIGTTGKLKMGDEPKNRLSLLKISGINNTDSQHFT